MSPRHDPQAFFASHDAHDDLYRDPALVHELDRDDSEAAFAMSFGDDE